MIVFDKYAYFNKLSKVDPFEKFIFAVLTMGILLGYNSILISTIVLVLMALIIIFKIGIPIKFYFKIMSIPIAFLAMGILTVLFNIVDVNSEIIFQFALFKKHLGITYSSLNSAGNLFLVSLSSVSCLYFLSLSTPVVDIISVLRKLKIPKLFIELMSLVYRFIFVLIDTGEKIYTSQNSRLGYSKLGLKFKSTGLLASVLFVRSFKRSNDLYLALESRCYDGEIRVLEEEFPTSILNYILIAIFEIMLIIIGIVYKL